MDKILIVARTEFGNSIRSKAFFVSLLMLPFIYGTMIVMQIFASRADTEPRFFAVIDRTGQLFPALRQSAEARNKTNVNSQGKPTAPLFLPREVKDEGRSLSEIVLTLSDQVRDKQLYAFIEIPADAVEAKVGEPIALKYYSNSPNYRDLREWVDAVVSSASRALRYKSAGIDFNVAARIDRPIKTENLGLAKRGEAARTIDIVRSVFIPLGLAMVVFMVTITVAPQLVGTVIEEKMSRISEMILASVSPFEFMMGKLLGNISQAMLTTSLYLVTGYFSLKRYGYADSLTPVLIASLLLFVTLGVILFGSLYLAAGSACSELKDAQAMIQPVAILSVLPMGMMIPVLLNPSGTISVVASLIPIATPLLMTMRMASNPAPPAWQVVLAIVLTTSTALFSVWAASKIFRTGVLMYGKAPSFRDLVRWIFSK